MGETVKIVSPMLLRAKITAEEYRDLRKEAIDRGLPVSEYVALVLRARAKGEGNDD